MIKNIWQIETPAQLQKNIAIRMKQRRKEMKLSQEMFSRKSGVSLGSLKRFESTGEISLSSLIKIAYALDMYEDFNEIFKRKAYQSIQEVIDEHSEID